MLRCWTSGFAGCTRIEKTRHTSHYKNKFYVSHLFTFLCFLGLSTFYLESVAPAGVPVCCISLSAFRISPPPTLLSDMPFFTITQVGVPVTLSSWRRPFNFFNTGMASKEVKATPFTFKNSSIASLPLILLTAASKRTDLARMAYSSHSSY